MEVMVYIIPVLGLLALGYSFLKNNWIMKQEVGTDKMAEISRYIREGAIAFLRTEYRILIIFVI